MLSYCRSSKMLCVVHGLCKLFIRPSRDMPACGLTTIFLFQWSVHVQREPAAALEHFEFLADEDCDPGPAFLQSLAKSWVQMGTIVVYNQSFESERLAELARWLPVFEGAVRNIQSRLWDLLAVMRTHVYHP